MGGSVCEQPIKLIWGNGLQLHVNGLFTTSGTRSVAKQLLVKGIERS